MSPSTRHPRGLLRTYVALIVAATVVTLGVAAVVALTTPLTYTSTAEVVLRPQLTTGSALQPQMGTERTIAQSGEIALRAAQRLGRSPDKASTGLTVSVALETTVLRISYTAHSADAALAGARAFSAAYVEYRNSGLHTPVAEVITEPELPTRGVGANLAVVLGLGLVAGLSLGIGSAWIWDRVTDRVRRPEDLEAVSGVEVMGELPRWSRRAGWLAPTGAADDAMAFVATHVATLVGVRYGLVVVSSPRRGAGTTTVAANLAMALAAQGRDVVLVGADLHAPRLHEAMGMAAAPGLLDVLDGHTTLARAVQQTERPHLRVLTLGNHWGGGGRFHVDELRLVLAELTERALVVVDAPPLLAKAEAAMLADLADTLVLVGDLQSGRRADIVDAMRPRQAAAAARTIAWVGNWPRHSRQSPTRAGAAQGATAPDEPGLAARTGT